MKIERVIIHLAVIQSGVLPCVAVVDEPAVKRLLAELLSAYLPEPEVKTDAQLSIAGNYLKTGMVKVPVQNSDWRTILFAFCAQARNIEVNSGAPCRLLALPTPCIEAFKTWRGGLDGKLIESTAKRLAEEAEAVAKATAEAVKKATK